MLHRSPTPVAIIGIGCRLPGNASNPQRLWDILAEGRNVWSPVPEDRYNEAAFLHPKPDNNGTTNHHGGHFLDGDISEFDAAFFGISPAEAKSMDPQQRFLLEVSYEAFENAGISIESLKGSNTAVFAAMFTRDYDRNVYKDTEDIPKYHTTGCGEAIMSNRISYTFDLRGPSITLDTGCSGGLVGLHQACQSLRAGETNLALACGVSIIMNPDQMIGMSNLHMLNEDGRCYPFDVRGSGYGRGEGVAAIVVKRLDDAIRDGDNIRAILLNTGVNQDGRTNGITHPNQSAQAILQRSLYSACGLNPSDTQFIEAHGTGTVAGDVAELGAISEVFCKDRGANDELYVGSIKSNIGHLESSSGLAAVIKAVLVLENAAIPPNADYTRPKPALEFIDQRIKIPVKLETMTNDKPHRASVNSFGYGGVNAHAILESFRLKQPFPKSFNEVDVKPKHKLCKEGDTCALRPQSSISFTCPTAGDETRGTSSRLFVLSANSQISVIHALSRLKSWVTLLGASKFNLNNLAYHLSCRRSMLSYRHAFVASSYEGFLSCVSSPKPAVVKKSEKPSIVFVFTGQGAQWYAMGRSLLFQFPIFRDSIIDSGVILRDLGASWDLLEELLSSEAESRINESEIAQPATTALQIALVDLLANFGIRPQTVIGHSSGEITAAYTAGVLTPRAALKVSFLRGLVSGLCKRTMPVAGAMLSVGLDERTILPLIDNVRKGSLVVACLNSPRNLTVSGDKAAIDELAKTLDGQRIFNRILKVDTAYHSHHMLHVANAYLESLGAIETSGVKKGVKFISTVTAKEKFLEFDSSYWVENLVSKVRFSEAVYEYLRQEPTKKGTAEAADLLVEIGPHSALRGPVLQSLDRASGSRKHLYCPTLERDRDAVNSVLGLVGHAFVHGHHPNFDAINGIADSILPLHLVEDLPPYAWDHENTFWHESRQSQEFRFRQHPYHDLLGIRIPGTPSAEPSWRYLISLEKLPWLQDHIIDGLTTFPGAAYMCMAIEAIQQVTHNDKMNSTNTTNFVLQDVKFLKALVLPAMPHTIEVQMSFRQQQTGTSSWQEFRIYSVSKESSWHEHCRGRIMATHTDPFQNPPNALEALDRLTKDRHLRYEAREIYDRLSLRGNSYGPSFASIKHIQIADLEALCELTIPNIKTIMPHMHQQPHIIHPTTLDAVMHSVVPLFSQHGAAGSVMPVSIEELVLSSSMPREPEKTIRSNINLHQSKARSASADVTAFDAEAKQYNPILCIRGMTILDVGTSTIPGMSSPDMRRTGYMMEWEEDIYNLNVTQGVEVTKKMTFPDYLRKLRFKLSSIRVLQLGLVPLGVTLSLLGQLCETKKPSLLTYELATETAEQWQQQRELLQDWGQIIEHCAISIRDLRSLDFKIQASYDVILMSIDQLASQELKVVAANTHKLLRPYGQLLIHIDNSDLLTTDVVASNEIFQQCLFRHMNISLTHITDKALGAHLAVYEAIRDASRSLESQVLIVAEPPISDLAGRHIFHTLEPQFNCSMLNWESVSLNQEATYIILDDGAKSSLAKADAQHFQKINKLLSIVSKVIWVIVAADAAGDNAIERALVVGMARTARSEYENLSMVTLEVTKTLSDCLEELPPLLLRLLPSILDPGLNLNEIYETEYLYHNGKVMIPRLVPQVALNNHLVENTGEPRWFEASYLNEEYPLKLIPSSSVAGDGFRFESDNSLLEICGPDEVIVEVRAHMLTPHVPMEKDFISTETSTQREFAGIVVNAGGKANEKFRIGDRVCAWGIDSILYPSHARTRAERVFHLPDAWSMVAAASLPIAFTSAYYILRHRADLQNGSTIVICGPAHPIAHAVIVFSMKVGARAIVIAATAAQRDEIISIHRLPASHVLVETGARLDRDVAGLTKGKGADVVLNASNSSSACDLSLFTRVHGTIVQIMGHETGPSYAGHTPFPSKPCTFISFDLVTLAIHDPRETAHLLEKAMNTFVENPAHSTFHILTLPISKIGDALALAKAEKSSRRIVLTADEETRVGVIHTKEKNIDFKTSTSIEHATYIVAGGLGDIGKIICRTMASLGAACIVTLSRRNLEQGQIQIFQDELRGYSAEARFISLSCDISNREAVYGAVRTIEELGLPPIKGVVQSATVLKDRVLERMTPEEFQRPLLTKIYGTRNLDEALRDKRLDFFIMLSSLSGIIGSRGQANYAAGNVFQDNFAQRRRGSQTRYVTLDLGMIEDTAIYTNREGRLREQNLLRQGFIPVKQDQLVALLKYVLNDSQSEGLHQVVVGIDGKSVKNAENATPTMKSAMFIHVRSEYDTPSSVEGETRRHETKVDHLESENIDEVIAAVTEIIGRHLAGLVLLEPEKLEYSIPLLDFGLDSLTAIDLKNFIHKEFNATIQASEIIDEVSLTGLGNRVVARSTRFGKLRKDKPEDFEEPLPAVAFAGTQDVFESANSQIIDQKQRDRNLPALPLPDLHEALDMYLSMARPFLSPESIETTTKKVDEFKIQAGKDLHEYLVHRAQTPAIDNWQHDLLVNGIYLASRQPIHPYGTFYCSHLAPTKNHSQSLRAAIISVAAYKFKLDLDVGSIKPDQLNKEPLCANTLGWLFNACRAPQREVDIVEKHSGNEYLIAMRRGHIFKIPLTEADTPLSSKSLASAFDDVIRKSEETQVSVASLTADERDSWATLREELKSVAPTNTEVLQIIEAAAFIICLDDDSPTTPTDRSNNLLLGNPGDRWSDKTLQFVVCQNGSSGYVCEHSMLDALSTRQLNAAVTKAILSEDLPQQELLTTSEPTIPTPEYHFTLNAHLHHAIQRIEATFRTSYPQRIEYCKLTLQPLTPTSLRRHKLAPKAGAQLTIQLAAFLHCNTGRLPPVWETLSLMPFHKGRHDWMQTVSAASLAFCTAACDPATKTEEERARLLRDAAALHTSTMSKIARGRGCIAYLEALRELVRSTHQDKDVPAIFEDATWAKMMRVTNPRLVKTDATEGLGAQEAGFYMPEEESVLVHYEIGEERGCEVFVQGMEGRASAFARQVERAAEIVVRLMGV